MAEVETIQQAVVQIARNGVRSVSKTIGGITFTGSGLNDMTNGGTFTGSEDTTYEIEIDATGTPDTFKWTKDGGTTYTTGVSITGSAQTLDDGSTITFAATTGHTLADKWSFTASFADVGVTGKPSVSLLTDASLSASADNTSEVLDCRNLSDIVLSVACTFNAGAGSGCRIDVLTSYDNVNWDTEAWASTGLAPTFSAGDAVQNSSNIDVKPAYIKIKITNLDGGQAITLIEITATKVR